jgi:pSer/pThr/pTyr-binding forkhead associated (FHA) protein
MRSWVIGNNPECDVVVDSPLASGRHCRLIETPEGLTLEDLGSTNGTYVDGRRITAAARIAPTQEITLGQTVAMPWPSELVKFLRIGRVPGNEIVLDDPRVSSRHARIMIVAGSQALIEDLGSSNGTFLNSADLRVTRLTSISSSDTIYFGSLAVPASQLLAGLLHAARPPAVPPSLAERREPLPEPVAAPPAVSFVEGNRWLLGALVQAPVLAFLIVLISGRQAAAAVTEANWASVGKAITATSFALAAAAVWLGCSIAVAELAGSCWPGRRREADPVESSLISLGSRVGVLVSVCALGCALLLAIVYWGAGLKGPWLPMWGVMAMASTVCLLLGLSISAVVKSWQTVALGLLGCFALMTALGGWLWPLAGKGLPLTVAAGATPARWAFEGVLLLESPHHHPPAPEGGAASAPDRDLAEDFFPADTERMGSTADALALGSMLIGMAAALALASTRPG